MKRYRDFDSGIIYTEEEVRHAFREFIEEKSDESFEDYLSRMLDLGRDKEGGYEEIEVKTGKSCTFEYGGIKFMFTVTDNFCDCFAESQYQFGIEIGKYGIDTDEDVIELIVNNYENGNIFIEE